VDEAKIQIETTVNTKQKMDIADRLKFLWELLNQLDHESPPDRSSSYVTQDPIELQIGGIVIFKPNLIKSCAT
jgi:hypothetical protein